MNVLLIVPGSSNIYAKLGSQLPSLGIAYIAAVCREHQHHVKIVDLGIDKNGLSTEVIEWANIVGISADTPGYPKALLIAKKLKEAGKKIFMGGYHVTFLDREALETGYVDFVVRGEGEEIVVNMLEALEKGESLADVLGISYLDNGVYKRNQDAPPPVNLDEMPFPARDLLPLTSYKGVLNGKPMTNLITSRGCPFNCYFCSSSRFGGLKWRARSAKSIADELEHLYRTYGYRAFAFMDDNFTLNPKRVFDFADEIERRGMTDISWWCFSRVDILVKNEAMVKRMAEVGAFMIFLGLESTNEEILDSYNKHIGNNQQQEAIALLRKYGIQIYGSYIIGDIQETEKMVNQTINWARKVNADVTQFSILTPFPGTALYDDIEKQNRFLHKSWEFYDALHPVVKLDHLTPPKTSQLYLKAYRRVYLNPSRIFASNKHKNEMKKNKDTRSLAKKGKDLMNAISFFVTFRKHVLTDYQHQKEV